MNIVIKGYRKYKMIESFKALPELRLKFIPKAWKQEAMAHKTTLKG